MSCNFGDMFIEQKNRGVWQKMKSLYKIYYHFPVKEPSSHSVKEVAGRDFPRGSLVKDPPSETPV